MADQDRYSKKQLAVEFEVTTRTIDNWRKRGWVPKPYRQVRELRWDKKQVEQIRKTLEACCATE